MARMKTWTCITTLDNIQVAEMDGWNVRTLYPLKALDPSTDEISFVVVFEREAGWTKAERRAEIGAAHINLKGSAE